MSTLSLKRSLLKTASVVALALFALPAMAQNYSAANIDPYGYGNVPLPPPQPMVMPSYQAQQAANGFVPLNRYSSQYGSTSGLYAGQSTPQPVSTAQYGVVPNYLRETRAAQYTSQQPNATQASSVGYVVQPQAGAAPQQAPSVAQYAPQYAPQAAAQYGAQTGAQYGSQVGAQVGQAAQPYAQSASNAYGTAQQVGQVASNPYAAAPQVSVSAPQVTVQAPSAYSPANTAVQSSITTAQTYDYAPATASSYQPLSTYQNTQQASAQPSYASQPSYAQQDASQGYQAQGYQYQAQAQQPAQPYGQPQVQTYAYNTQPQTYTTTQIYTPSPALTVQQTADANSQAYAQPYQTAQNTAPVVEENVSYATDPSVGPWYFSLRSGLTLAQDTAFRRAGSDVVSEYAPGWQLGTGVGYEFKAWNNWVAPRAELELVYDQQLVDSHTNLGTKTTDPNAYGFQRNLDLMANGFLDFRLNRYLSPYVGGGIGIGYADFDRYGTSAGGVAMDDNDVGFVWQAMGGLGINLSSSTMVDFGYRYLQNTGVTLSATDGTKSTTDVGKHVLMVGFRNNF